MTHKKTPRVLARGIRNNSDAFSPRKSGMSRGLHFSIPKLNRKPRPWVPSFLSRHLCRGCFPLGRENRISHNQKHERAASAEVARNLLKAKPPGANRRKFVQRLEAARGLVTT